MFAWPLSPLIGKTLEDWQKAKPPVNDPDFYDRCAVGHLYELGVISALCGPWGRMER